MTINIILYNIILFYPYYVIDMYVFLFDYIYQPDYPASLGIIAA